MATRDRAPWRIAAHVRRELQQMRENEQRTLVDQLRLASSVLTRITALLRKLDRALLRRWHGAAERISAQLRRAREEAAAELAALDRVTARSSPQVPSMRDLVEDLAQLEEELDGWRFDRVDGTLSVTTEPIELEGVRLGRFAIKLRIGDLAAVPHNRTYEILALDPNPAAGSPQVTHPHVADERLCEGEATSALRNALAGGRLCDFFVLVRSVLSHYNPNSPYVELESWHGEPCAECGDRVDDDRGGTCRRCETFVCDECGSVCADCHETHCPGCLDKCSVCDDLVCTGCIERCADCGARCCGQCIDDELCPTCHQQREEPEDHDEREQDEHQRQAPEPPGAHQPHAPRAPAHPPNG